jgi:hypothetical protein
MQEGVMLVESLFSLKNEYGFSAVSWGKKKSSLCFCDGQQLAWMTLMIPVLAAAGCKLGRISALNKLPPAAAPPAATGHLSSWVTTDVMNGTSWATPTPVLLLLHGQDTPYEP